jgi:Hypothetical methyltransferase
MRRNRNKFKQDTDPSTAQTAQAQRVSSAAAVQASISGMVLGLHSLSTPETGGLAQQAAAAGSLHLEGAQPGQQRRRSSSAAAATPPQQQGSQRQAAGPAAADQPKRKKRKRQQEQSQAAKPAADAVPATKLSAAAQPSAESMPAPQPAAAATAAVPPAAAPPRAAGGSKLLDKMRGKLQGGRFRWLNEQLYTSTGGEALRMMQVWVSVAQWVETLVTMHLVTGNTLTGHLPATSRSSRTCTASTTRASGGRRQSGRSSPWTPPCPGSRWATLLSRTTLHPQHRCSARRQEIQVACSMHVSHVFTGAMAGCMSAAGQAQGLGCGGLWLRRRADWRQVTCCFCPALV